MSPLAIGLGWLAFGPIVFALAWACMTIENWLKNRNARIEAAMRRHPAGKAKNSAAVQAPTPQAPPRNQCDQTGCAHPATMWEIVNAQHGGGLRWVCLGHHHEGTAKGWWKRTLPATATALDFMVEDECHDLDQIDELAQQWAGEGA